MAKQEALYQFGDARLPLVDDDYDYISQDDQNPKNRKVKLINRKAYFSLQANTTIEINPGLTTAQIQALIDAVPKCLNDYTLTFTFKTGTHDLTGPVYFDGFTGGNLVVQGEASTFIRATVANASLLSFSSCSSKVTVDNLTLQSAALFTAFTNILFFENIGKVTISNITAIDSNFALQARFTFLTCNGSIETSNMSYMSRGVSVSQSSLVTVNSSNTFGTGGSANTKDVVSSSAIAIYTGDSVTDGITTNKLNGGQIADNVIGWL